MNVLFLTQRLPYAPNRGDRVRAYFLLKLLQSQAHVTVLSLVHDDAEAMEGRRMTGPENVHVVRVPRLLNLANCIVALPTSTPLTHAMLDAPGLPATLSAIVKRSKPDVVLAYCSGMARLAFLPALATTPMLLDMVDVDSAKWRDLGDITRFPMEWVYRREARTLARFESRAVDRSVATMVVTPRERDELRNIAPNGRIEVVPNGIDVDALRPPEGPAESNEAVFCGVMNYAPNEQAAVWLAREIWPLVQARRPDARLTLVGATPSATVQGLHDPARGITVTGSVPDVRPYLWRAAVAVAPLRTARGIQNKVLEAVAAGLPTIVTPKVFDSLPTTVAAACRTGETTAVLAEAIVEALGTPPAERRRTAGRADVASLRWEQQLSMVPSLLEEAARGVSRRGP